MLLESISNVHKSWLPIIKPEADKAYFVEIEKFLLQEKNKGAVIYPAIHQIFNACNLCTLSNLKVVIIGQDPYHTPGMAHGLSFSVPQNMPIPPSLKNIFKALEADVNIINSKHGCLDSWAKQGVLLLNTILTVRHAQPASHAQIGWHFFTMHVLNYINKHCNNIVFMLWGKPAQKFGLQIISYKHLVLTAPHPSPLSAYRGFIGCNHFSKANNYLLAHNKTPINWQIE